MEVELVVDMEVYKVADMEVDLVADMKVDTILTRFQTVDQISQRELLGHEFRFSIVKIVINVSKVTHCDKSLGHSRHSRLRIHGMLQFDGQHGERLGGEQGGRHCG